MADQPNFELPEDFTSVGEQMFAGVLKVALENIDPKKIGVLLADILGPVLGALAAAAAPIGVGLAKGIANAEDIVAPELADVAATAVGDMFGTDVPAAAFTSRSDRAGRSKAATALGAGFLKAIEGQGGPIEPSDEAAKRYLGTVLNMALEGWWQGWFFEFMSSLIPYFDIGKIESFAELDDTVAQALGLGRLSRRVLGPMIDATVVTPLRWKVNKQYRPELLSPAAAIESYLRGEWDFDALNEELSRQGFDPKRILALIGNAAKRLSVEQLLFLNYRGALSEADVLTRVRALGYDERTAAELIQIERTKLRDKWLDPIVDAAVAAFVAGDIGEGELARLVEGAAPTHAETQFIITAARAKRALRVRTLSPADERRLALKGIRSVVDFRRALEREGFVPDAVTALELELRAELADRKADEQLRADQAAERDAEKAAAAAAKLAREAELAARAALPTLQEYRRAYVRGHIERATFAGAIVRERIAIAPGDLELLMAEADEARADFLESQQRATTATAKRVDPALSVGTLEGAVLAGVLTLSEFDARVHELGYDDDERRVIVSVLAAKLEDREEARTRRDGAAETATGRGISLTDFERAVRLGLRSRADYVALLAELEPNEAARALTLDLLDDAMSKDAAARAAREARDPAAAAAGLSLTQRRRAVVAGVLPRAAYEAALITARWPADDMLVELALLDLELEEAAAARAKRDAIAAELAAKQAQEAAAAGAITPSDVTALAAPALTLNQVERAVRLGVLPPDALRAWLRERAYSEADIGTIVQLAVDAIPDVRAGQQLERQVAGELAARRISLHDLKRAVARGIRTLEDYAGDLRANGYGEDAIALLVQLLAEEIAIDLDGLRAKVRKVLEAAEGAPALEEIAAAAAAGELDAATLRDLLAMFGVPRDTALVFSRLLLSFGVEG